MIQALYGRIKTEVEYGRRVESTNIDYKLIVLIKKRSDFTDEMF